MCSKTSTGKSTPDFSAQIEKLKKALKKYLKPGDAKGRKAELAVIETACFDVCPKNAVVCINAAEPKALLIVPVGADLFEVKARLGLRDDRRLKAAVREAPQ